MKSEEQSTIAAYARGAHAGGTRSRGLTERKGQTSMTGGEEPRSERNESYHSKGSAISDEHVEIAPYRHAQRA